MHLNSSQGIKIPPRRCGLSSVLFPLVAFVVVIPVALAAIGGGATRGPISAQETFRLRREAMLAALNVDGDGDAASVSGFASVREARSYYYFHSGVPSAAMNALIMSGGDAEDLMDDDDALEDAYFDYLEGVLERQLESARSRLRDAENGAAKEEEGAAILRKDGHRISSDTSNELNVKMAEEDEMTQSDADDQDAHLRQLLRELEVQVAKVSRELREMNDGKGAERSTGDESSTDKLKDDVSELPKEEEDGSAKNATKDMPEERLHKKFREEYANFRCHRYPRPSAFEAPAKWAMLRRHFWEFTVGHPALNDEVEDGEDDDEGIFGYVPDAKLYVNYTTTTKTNAKGANVTKTRLGLFAAVNFHKDKVVYSSKQNALYFQEPSSWSSYLRSLPNERDSCLALEWSSSKKVSRPGRWLVGLQLDEGAFMRRLKGDRENDGDGEGEGAEKGNVSLDDDRGFNYVALSDINEGEEIVDAG